MTLFTPICERCTLLPYYLRYYARLGIDQFVLALWNGRDNPEIEAIEAMSSGYNVRIETSVRCRYEDYCGPAETNGLNDLREKYVRDDEWYAIADLDEFCWFGGFPMTEVPRLAEERGFLAVHGRFRDRLGEGGRLMPVPVNGSLDNTFPWQAWLTNRTGACHDKICLAHKSVPIHSGHHEAPGIEPHQLWRDLVEVHHFKWIAGVQHVLRARHKHYVRQGHYWAHESQDFLNLLKGDCFDLSVPELFAERARRLGI